MGSRLRFILIAAVLVALTSGCEEPRHVAGETPAPPAKKEEDKFIVGKRTTDIRDANAEVQKKGAVVTAPRIIAKDPITLSGETSGSRGCARASRCRLTN